MHSKICTGVFRTDLFRRKFLHLKLVIFDYTEYERLKATKGLKDKEDYKRLFTCKQ